MRSLLLASALLTIAVTANAQERSADLARAEHLFEQAKKQLADGDVAKACAGFAESQKLDPQLGTLLNLALCHEREGKIASAWAELTAVVSQATRAGQAKRVEFAKDRAKALEAKLSRVRFDISALPANAKVTLDGSAVEPSSLRDTPIPLDPGSHAIAVTADGKKPAQQTVTVARGPSTSTFKLDALVDAEAVVATPTPHPALAPTPPPPPPPPPQPSGLTGMQWAGLGAGVVGLGGIAVGSIFGLSASSLKDESGCQATCTTSGAGTLGEARDAAMISTIGFVAGAVLLAAGVTLFVLPRSSPPVQARR